MVRLLTLRVIPKQKKKKKKKRVCLGRIQQNDSDTESIDSIDTEEWKYDRVQTELYSDSDTESIDSTDTQVGSREEEEEERENRYIITRATTSQHGRLPRPRLIRQNAIQNLYKGDPSAAAEDNDNRLKPWLRLKNEQLK